MMKTIFAAGALALLVGLSGCTEEAQYERAVDNVVEERQETREAIRDAQEETGEAIREGRQEVREEQLETREAELEAQKQRNDMLDD
jgi:uncharacterized membrane protein